jgi:hypothetical protein
VRHETTVREPNHEQTPGINVRHYARLVENFRKSRNVIEPLMVEITAKAAGIPEATLPRVKRTVGSRVSKLVTFRELVDVQNVSQQIA